MRTRVDPVAAEVPTHRDPIGFDASLDRRRYDARSRLGACLALETLHATRWAKERHPNRGSSLALQIPLSPPTRWPRPAASHARHQLASCSPRHSITGVTMPGGIRASVWSSTVRIDEKIMSS